MQRLIITLDGPAGSGKSTAARLLAKRLGLEFLDTGAMYRAVAILALDHEIDLTAQGDAVGALARACRVQFDWQTDPPRLLLDGQDVTDRLRDQQVTAGASAIATIGAVRSVLVAQQQRIGREHPRLVSEGRDQGSVVFPDAQVKFYLDASVGVRAQRRADQIRQTGREADLQAIQKAIIDRDQQDSTRKDGPLVCPKDAWRIDTSGMAINQVLDLLESIVQQQVGTAGFPGPGVPGVAGSRE